MQLLRFNRLQIFLAVICILAASLYIGNRSYEDYLSGKASYEDSVKSSTQNLAYNASLLFYEAIRPEKELLLSTASQLEALDFNNTDDLERFIGEKGKGFTTVQGIFFGGSDGKNIGYYGDRGFPSHYDPRTRPWYKQAVESNGFIVTSPYPDAITKKLCITLAVPVYKNGIFKGVLGLDMFLDRFHTLFNNLTYGQKSSYFLTDDTGRILITDNEKYIGENLSDILAKLSGEKINANWHNILSNDNGRLFFKSPDKRDINGYYWTAEEQNWKVIVIANPDQYLQQLNEISSLSLSVGGVRILVILLIFVSLLSLVSFIQKGQTRYILTHDVLTGMPNRQYLELSAKKKLSKYKNDISHCLLFIDIDNFKFLNDTFGHNIGDEMLKSLAGLIKNFLPKESILARTGGDEFAVFLPHTSHVEAKTIAESIQRSFNDNPVVLDGNNFDISLSIGLTSLNSSDSIMKFFSHANAALNIAKQEGKNKVVCLLPEDENMNLDNPREINRIVSMIKTALKENRFFIYLQPIVETGSVAVSHYEALIRLKDQEDNIISPGFFIPIAERFGMIAQIDKWVFGTVLELLKKHRDITVFINLSALSLMNNSLLEYFEKSIIESGFAPEELKLGIEITETASTRNFPQAQRWMKRFKELGCTIALDDFGVGYTSFTYLRLLPVDYIKIDGSFIQNIDKDSSHKAIVQAVNSLAEALGKKTIAEFVETEAILNVLKEIGINYGQGYFLGKPSPLEDIIK